MVGEKARRAAFGHGDGSSKWCILIATIRACNIDEVHAFPHLASLSKSHVMEHTARFRPMHVDRLVMFSPYVGIGYTWLMQEMKAE